LARPDMIGSSSGVYIPMICDGWVPGSVSRYPLARSEAMADLKFNTKPLLSGNRTRLGIVAGIQLIAGVLEALARIGARHQVRMLVRCLDLVDPDLSTQIVRIPLLSGEPVEILSGRRPIAAVGIEKAEHVIKGSVLQHELDDVVDLPELVCHGRSRLDASPLIDTTRQLRRIEDRAGCLNDLHAHDRGCHPSPLMLDMPQSRQQWRQPHCGLTQVTSEIRIGPPQQSGVCREPAGYHETRDRCDPGA
jgi:hypothetical protein